MMRGGASRRVLSLAAVAAVTAALLPASALALSCAARQYTLSEAYDAADSIVVGLVTECKDTRSRSVWTGGGSDCSFVSLEVLKEASPARDYGGLASSQDCGLSLFVGNQYLLFLDSENQPLFYSAPLSGGDPLSERTGSYLRILREFRDDASRELSEPWTTGEQNDTCFLSHQVGGHQIVFSRGKVGAPAAEWPTPEWTRETEHGQTVYRGLVRLPDTGSVPMSIEFTTTGDFSQYAPDMLILRVSLQEWQPVPPRNATLSVGSQVWPLHRVETVSSRGDWRGDPMVHHQAFGEVAEEILSAMLRPSDVVVSASLVPAVDADSLAPTAERDVSVTTRLEPSLKGDALAPSGEERRAHVPAGNPPPAVLRLETRSTQLANAIGQYRACYNP